MTGPALRTAEERGREVALDLDQVSAGYGRSMVIREVSAWVGRGEIVVIVGPNGAGKSTLLKAVAGVIPIATGRVTLTGRDVTNSPTEKLAQSGIGYVPQSDDVFADLTVRENLMMGGYLLTKQERKARVEEVVSTYPLLGRLISRRVLKLSGGERKLVGIGRALMNRPQVLLLDEPSAGLAPQLSREILTEEVGRLAQSGVAVLLVEQKAIAALSIAHWSYVLAAGQRVLSSCASDLLARNDMGEIFLGKVVDGRTSAVAKTAERGAGNVLQDR
jgi:branched-chain amino acid transport system ATP-binding protein